jgi:DNA-binding transcriptional LysR family regulator
MDMGWDHWRSFLAVIDEGSLSAAARKLGLTQPTLGRHVDQLETALKASLFLRGPTGLIATELALSLVPQARAMAAAEATLRRTASGAGDGESGTVRLTASEVVGVEILPAILAGFVQAYPRIRIELAVSNRNEDLLRHDADIAVRMLRPVQGAVLAVPLGTVPLGLFAHRRYVAQRGLPGSVADLPDHILIGPEDARLLAGVTLDDLPVVPQLFSLRSDSDLAQLALLRAGAGIGICQAGIAARDPDLVPVLPEAATFAIPAWLAMHEDQRANRSVRLLYTHLSNHLGLLWRPGGRLPAP